MITFHPIAFITPGFGVQGVINDITLPFILSVNDFFYSFKRSNVQFEA